MIRPQILAYVFMIIGFLCQFFFNEDSPSKLGKFLYNFSVELFGIGLTVIIIDKAVERRQMQEIKEKLIRELGSEHNATADSAARELRNHYKKNSNWLEDGSLRRKNFRRANLTRVDLRSSNFNGAILRRANLTSAKLVQANLVDADMRGICLHKAYVGMFDSSKKGADLTGADLFLSDLSSSDCSKANFLNTKLDKCNFMNARMEFALNLDKVLTFNGSFYNESTTWPIGFDPNSWGLQKVTHPPFVTGPETPANSLERP